MSIICVSLCADFSLLHGVELLCLFTLWRRECGLAAAMLSAAGCARRQGAGRGLIADNKAPHERGAAAGALAARSDARARRQCRHT